jgi:uncharacterized protein
MPDVTTTAIVVAVAFALAGTVKGIAGMGLPTVAMGVMALVMHPAQAAALLVFPSLATNLWQLFAGPTLVPVVKRLLAMMVFVAIGTFIGIRLLTGGSPHVAPTILGLVLAVYATAGLLKVSFSVPRSAERRLSPAIGFITGLLTGATGIFLVPAVPYLAALDMDREQLIQALGFSFTGATLLLATALVVNGAYPPAMAGGSLLAVVPAVAGMYFGQRVRTRLSPDAFRRWFFGGVLLVGLYMVLRELRIG